MAKRYGWKGLPSLEGTWDLNSEPTDESVGSFLSPLLDYGLVGLIGRKTTELGQGDEVNQHGGNQEPEMTVDRLENPRAQNHAHHQIRQDRAVKVHA